MGAQPAIEQVAVGRVQLDHVEPGPGGHFGGGDELALHRVHLGARDFARRRARSGHAAPPLRGYRRGHQGQEGTLDQYLHGDDQLDQIATGYQAIEAHAQQADHADHRSVAAREEEERGCEGVR